MPASERSRRRPGDAAQQLSHERRGAADDRHAQGGKLQAGIENGQGGDDGDAEQRAAQDIQPAGREAFPERLGQRHAAQMGQGHARGQQQEHAGGPQQRGRGIAQPEIDQGRRAGRQRDEDAAGPPEIEARMQAGRHPDDEHPRQTGHEQVLAGKGQAVGEVAGIEGLYGGRLQ